ncbi:MAG: hypothetical protein D6728_18055 [Cyanobacteria bacterium J055]|nr:MAG: hypothetical protein D6728_18055 [Cyanobacteria bacterium J055]
MTYWEFLIQQEGTKAWLPLKSSSTEIVAGRYRVMARSDLPNTPAELCVSYENPQTPDADPQTYKRTKQTNADGLMVVLPYTDFTPGVWQLGCSGRRGEGAAQADWQYAVRLNVLSQVPQTPTAEPQPPTAPTEPSYRLSLQQEAHTVKPRDKSIVLSGRIEATVPLERLHLRIRLRDPQTAKSVVTTQRILPYGESPAHFCYSINLPFPERPQLLLGEVLLCDVRPTVLDSRSFTVTASVDGLLGVIDETVTQQGEANLEEWIDRRPHVDAPQALRLPAVRTWREPQVPALAPEDRHALPPLLRPPATQPLKPRSIALPFEENPPQSSSSPPSEPKSQVPETTDTVSPEPPAPAKEEAKVIQLPITSDRFTSRLNELVKDKEELSPWLEAEISTEGNPFVWNGENQPQSGIPDWATYEIVVDEETLDLTSLPSTPTAAEPEIPDLFQLPPDEPIPLPTLVVPNGKLTSGKAIVLRVRLPQVKSRIYVKLWVHDRQNQMIVEEPRWITDFLPLNDREVETAIQISLPHGALEVQFEAIAVEALTQRESGKVTIERQVLPPVRPYSPWRWVDKFALQL